MDLNKYVKLSHNLGILIVDILKEKGYEPRTNNMGILSLEFSQEELDQITELTINNPMRDGLKGIENLRNLKKLKISSSYSAYQKNNLSISDKDIKAISKLTSLEELAIENQGNITWLDLTDLTNLKRLTVIKNNKLEDVLGLENLKKVEEVAIYGNKELYELPHIQELITSNELDALHLDLLHYPEVAHLKGILNKIMDCNFVEYSISRLLYNWGITSLFHEKCAKIIEDISNKAFNKKDILILVEKYLAENITYDHEGRETKNRKFTKNGEQKGMSYGTQSAYNGIMYGSCVCEGYTRSMQYLLKMLGIRTKNVSCISGADKISIDTSHHNLVTLPDNGYHSIIRVDLDNDLFYCDPCWDSCSWHAGDKSLPYCLKSKKDILKDHTLSFEEDNVTLSNYPSVDKDYIKSVVEISESKRQL